MGSLRRVRAYSALRAADHYTLWSGGWDWDCFFFLKGGGVGGEGHARGLSISSRRCRTNNPPIITPPNPFTHPPPSFTGLLDLMASFPRAVAELDRLDLAAQDLKGACHMSICVWVGYSPTTHPLHTQTRQPGSHTCCAPRTTPPRRRPSRQRRTRRGWWGERRRRGGRRRRQRRGRTRRWPRGKGRRRGGMTRWRS